MGGVKYSRSTKVCSKCGIEYPVAEFFRTGCSINNKCKVCQAEYNRAKYIKNRTTDFTRDLRYNPDILNTKIGKLTVISYSHSVGARSYFNCDCECGGFIVVCRSNLGINGTKSCGCIPCGVPSPKVGSNIAQRYRVYKQSSARRGINFELTIEEFSEVVLNCCFYCGAAPSSKAYGAAKDSILISGVDRVDNTIGYVYHNVVPCCKACNYAKHTRGLDDFCVWANNVYHHLIKGTNYEVSIIN